MAVACGAFGATERPYTVGAYYYSWYGGADNPHWPSGVAHKPWLGYYQSASPDTARKQIDVAARYGVDVFSVSWTGIGSPSERKFKAGLLQASNLSSIRFSILYESSIRLAQGSAPIDFNIPKTRDLFVSDMVYLARTYFGNPSYFKIDGRPVVSFYITRTFRGEFPPVLTEARRQIKALGYDVYLIGDSLAYGRNDLYIMSQFDAVTNYSLFALDLPARGIENTAQLADATRPMFWNFQYLIRDLKVGTSGKSVDFQPGVIPQFDARTRRGNDAAVLAQSKDDVKHMLQMAKEFLDAKTSGNKIVWITSWNEWHEGTSIEPTIDNGPKYPGGNFGWDFVEAVSEVFSVR